MRAFALTPMDESEFPRFTAQTLKEPDRGAEAGRVTCSPRTRSA